MNSDLFSSKRTSDVPLFRDAGRPIQSFQDVEKVDEAVYEVNRGESSVLIVFSNTLNAILTLVLEEFSDLTTLGFPKSEMQYLRRVHQTSCEKSMHLLNPVNYEIHYRSCQRFSEPVLENKREKMFRFRENNSDEICTCFWVGSCRSSGKTTVVMLKSRKFDRSMYAKK